MRELVDAGQISAQKAYKIDPHASFDRVLVMLNLILGLLIGSIAWVYEKTFAYSDLAYLPAFLALYGLSNKLVGRAAFFCAMGLAWGLAVGIHGEIKVDPPPIPPRPTRQSNSPAKLRLVDVR